MVRRWVFIGLVLCAQVAHAGKASPAKQAYEQARKLYFSLKASPEKQRLRHNWLRVITAFNDIPRAHPKTDEAASALYTTAELWADLYLVSRTGSDLDQARSSYARLAQSFPKSRLADDALYELAELYVRKGDKTKAAATLATLLAQYSKGDQVQSAQKLAKTLPAAAPKAQSPVLAESAPIVGRRDEQAPTPQITGIKHWSNPTYSRVVLSLTGAATARAQTAEPGTSLVVEIDGAELKPGTATTYDITGDLLQRAQVTAPEPKKVLLTLTLKAAATPRVLVLENPYRVVVDAITEPVPKLAQAKRKVVLDPGHGGHDVGALGKHGAKESDVALSIANVVRQKLEAAGVEVVMTRTADVFVSLEERTAIANRAGADAFVSIHCNAHKNEKAQGVETYYLDTTNDRYAIKLAARENSTQEDHVSDVQLVLADLATKVSARDSKDLAESVQRRLMKAVKPFNKETRDLGVKGSLFYVLLGARMPAVLVETSFISNGTEEKLLISDKYQGAVAEAVTSGILAQFPLAGADEALASRK